MILFSSFSDFFVLILFLYTGVLSGFLFYCTNYVIKQANNKFLTKIFSKEQDDKKQKSKKIFTSFFYVLFQILQAIVLVCCMFLSWYVNLYYNYGHIRIVYIIVWVFGFLASTTTLKIFAKRLFFFYNKKKKAKIEDQQ